MNNTLFIKNKQTVLIPKYVYVLLGLLGFLVWRTIGNFYGGSLVFLFLSFVLLVYYFFNKKYQLPKRLLISLFSGLFLGMLISLLSVFLILGAARKAVEIERLSEEAGDAINSAIDNWALNCEQSKKDIQLAKEKVKIIQDHINSIPVTPDNIQIKGALNAVMIYSEDLIDFTACLPESRGPNCEKSIGAICFPEGKNCLISKGNKLIEDFQRLSSEYPEFPEYTNITRSPEDLVSRTLKSLDEHICFQ